MKKNHLFGAILLIAGTTLGVGMLAFPTVTSFSGFFPSALLFVLIWLLMLSSSFFFLDANLSIKGQNNMITMAEKRLGLWGKIVAWVVYLLLLYSLTAAYITGCTPLFIEVVKDWTGYTMPHWLAPFALPLIFGGFVYAGTQGVDRINRILMVGLVVSFVLLIFFLPAEVDLSRLSHVDYPALQIAIPTVITAFGYHIIIPSLTTYLNRDRKALRKAILIGSLVPIIVYLFWQVLVLGAVPLQDLAGAFVKGEASTHPLARVLQNPFISLATKFFSFFAIITSFVGVTLSLSDFLTDGFKIKKTHSGRMLAILLTFVPPLFFVLSYPDGFYLALNYAGAFVAILLVFLPAAMVWNLKNYQTPLKRLFLSFVIFIAGAIVFLDIQQERGKLRPLIAKYLKKDV
ncbi:MAG: aromatic amino acid transport family protein [Simkaniaceae bacterium]|nr:aromatic amino acid transport family protein [Candidatus Sacchlamyda saccharinae]